MATDPETQQNQYQFSSLSHFLEGMHEAIAMLPATPCVDRSGKLRFVTDDGQVCCPVTLLDRHVNGTEIPVNRVTRVLERQQPLLPPHLLEVIRNAADNEHVMSYWLARDERQWRPTFERDVQHELDQAAGVLAARRHRMVPDAQQLQVA